VVLLLHEPYLIDLKVIFRQFRWSISKNLKALGVSSRNTRNLTLLLGRWGVIGSLFTTFHLVFFEETFVSYFYNSRMRYAIIM